jgi:hypothetical protein
MGGSYWSDDGYRSAVSHSLGTHGTAFTYDADIKAGTTSAKVHSLLDPFGLKVRESRDSAAHPHSNAILLMLDVTGSMGRVIKAIHEGLPKLMGLLLRKNYIVDPQILSMAVGDATCDRVSLQVGQFESGVEMEGDLSRLFIEGGGGGQNTESYELGAYVAARKTALDCFEKRGKQGYAFIMGDELPYPRVKRSEVARLIGDPLEADLTAEQIFTEMQAKYHTFYILPTDASNGGNATILNRWRALINPQHVLQLADANAIAELIATQIGLFEGTTDFEAVHHDLAEAGSTALVRVVTDALSKEYRGGALAAATPGTLTPAGGRAAKRL